MLAVGAAVEVADLHKRYDVQPVLSGLSFSVATGSIYCLLGRNGAGKTSTVECIEGFRRPDRGTIRVLGLDPVTDRAALAPDIGVMLQEGGAYQAASPREMLQLYRRLYPRAWDVEELLDITDLAPLADRRLRTLSGGEKQRVYLALALVGRPQVLFLDEPTAGMDPATRRGAWTLVERLRGEGVAILLTTHLLDEVERLADRVGILARGQIVAEDSPMALTGAASEVVLETSDDLDAAALATAINAEVRRTGSGRYLVATPPDRISAITAWVAEHGHPLHGITPARRSLEDVFLDLTGGAP